MTEDQIRNAVNSAIQPLVKRVDRLVGQRTLLLLVAALSLIVAIVSILYGINREDAFQEQLDVNRTVVCASAKSTALAPRKEPLAGESRNHYLNRLEAQREQLIAVGNLRCPTLPGFATFPYLRAQALDEIESILRRLAPEKLRQALGARHNGVRSNGPAFASTPETAAPTAGPAEGGGGRAPPASGTAPAATPQHHNPSPKPHPAGGNDNGGSTTTPSPPPQEVPASNDGGGSVEPSPPAQGGGDEDGDSQGEGEQSVVSPALDNTCNLPVVNKLLCTPR